MNFENIWWFYPDDSNLVFTVMEYIMNNVNNYISVAILNFQFSAATDQNSKVNEWD